MFSISNKQSKHKYNVSILFLFALFTIDLFGFNPDRLEGSVVTRNLILPYFS